MHPRQSRADRGSSSLLREAKSSKALSSSLSSKFLLPLSTCFLRAWRYKRDLEPHPLASEMYDCLYKKGERTWVGGSPQDKRPTSLSCFSPGPLGILRVHRWSQPISPGRATPESSDPGSCHEGAALPDGFFCTLAGEHEGCLACVVG